jgi:hypothetical protein
MKVKVLGGLFALVIFCCNVQAQRLHYVLLDTKKPIEVTGRSFYIAEVIDARVDTTTIGIVYVGPFKAFHRAAMPKSCAWYLARFFRKSLPEESGQEPITLKIEKFRVEERVLTPVQNGWVDMTLSFYHHGRLVYQTTQQEGSTGRDVTKQHAEHIQTALQNAMVEFNDHAWDRSDKADRGNGEEVKVEASAEIIPAPIR